METLEQNLHKFTQGKLVVDVAHNVRGVIIDYDPEFSLSDSWYDSSFPGRPAKNQPWYHVLVDHTSEARYLPEQYLLRDEICTPIKHPLIGHYFNKFDQGSYQFIKAD